MNKYEEKFKKVIAAKVTSLESRETAIKHLKVSIANIQELLKSWKDDKEVFPEVKSGVIECTNKKLEELTNRQCIYKDEIARIKCSSVNMSS